MSLKKFRFGIIACTIFYLSWTCAFAQQSDTIRLNSVEISGSRINVFNSGIQINEIDSATIANTLKNNLAEILSASTSVFVKSYGAGSSATISSRGTEARHTAVLWNGFNINSSSLGVADIANIQANTTNSIKLITGGSSPLTGSSSIGGALILENTEPVFEKQFHLKAFTGFGSYGNKSFQLNPEISSKNLVSRTVLFANSSDNNFSYFNEAKRDNPEEKLTNSKVSSYGLIQDFDYKINSSNLIKTGIWYQVNERQIPPMMTIPVSAAIQRDSVLRIYLGYRKVFKNSALKIKGAYFDEHQFYSDSIQSLDLRYKVTNYMSEAEYMLQVNSSVTINGGINYIYSLADIKEYENSTGRYQFATFINSAFSPFRGWSFNLDLRIPYASGVNPPLSPLLGYKGKIYKEFISIRGSAGRHFSLPSMNDLYWVPGGNPDLKPEDAWSYESGLIFFEKHKSMPEISFNYYRSVVKNWIKWQPVSGGIYAPENLNQVKTSGVEAGLNYKLRVKNLLLMSKINYTYSKSVLEQTDEPFSSDLIGKQLIYIPEHMFNLIFNIRYNTFSLTINHTYTGERYVTSDNQESLPGFNLTDLTADKLWKCKRMNFILFGRINNLFDSDYQVLKYRPTPGRWFSTGLRIDLNLYN